MYKNFILFILLSLSTLSQDMKIEIDKPILDNFIIINVLPDGKAPPPKEFPFHRVKKGETLGGIAYVYDKKTKTLVEINELKNPNLIFPKQKIYLENKKRLNLDEIPEFHIVQPGENIIEIAYFYELDFRDIIRINNLNQLVLQPNQKLKLKE